MTGFDFGKHFDKPQESKSVQRENPAINLLDELLKAAQQSSQKSASSSKKYSGPITADEAHEAFVAVYESPENFMNNRFDELVDPICEVMVEAAGNLASRKNEKTPITVLTAAAVEAARQCNMKMMSDNNRKGSHANELDAMSSSIKASMLGSAVNNMLPDQTPADSMIAVHALLGVVSMKLGELTMQLEAQQLAEKARNKQ